LFKNYGRPFSRNNKISGENTALTETHKALGAKIVPFAGYNMPVQYEGVKIEHETVRQGVGVFDVSHMGEFLIDGDHALELIQKVSSNDASKLTIGKAQYSCLPNDDGGIVDDLIIYRVKENTYLLVVNASNIEKDWNWIQAKNDVGANMRDLSENYSLLCKNEEVQQIWDKVLEAGADFGIKPIGLAARDTLRLEMGYCLYGNDIDDTTSPIEAGLGWITKFTKPFTNSEALKAEKERGSERKLIAFELNDRGIPRHGYDIVDGQGKTIGIVTSGTMSPSLGKGIGLGYVPTVFADVNSKINIQIRKNAIPATVVKLPFYKS